MFLMSYEPFMQTMSHGAAGKIRDRRP
jgi:hypothetical protein